MPRFFRVAVVLAALGGAVVASAAGDDRAAAEALLKEVDASPRKDVASELVTRSRGALDRGAKLRSSGDEAHAKLADRLARTWAEAARDVARAAAVEESAANARRSLTDAGLVAERERALLEEAIAQSGRLRAQLEAAPREAKEQPARTSTTANSDAGAKKPAPPVAAKDAGAAKEPGAPAEKDSTGKGAAAGPAAAKDGGAGR
jgi:hypothetical protein